MKRLYKVSIVFTIILIVILVKTNKVKAFGQSEHKSLVLASHAILKKEVLFAISADFL
jgi:hypothetical protein